MSRRIVIASLLGVLCVAVSATTVWAVAFGFFDGTDRQIASAKDIVILEVTGTKDSDGDDGVCVDGVFSVEVEILKTLKGHRALGKTTLATHWPTIRRGCYLAVCGEGQTLGTDLLAMDQLSLVPITNLDLNSLDGKPLGEQLAAIYRNRLAALDIAQKELAEERAMVELAFETAVDPTSPRSAQLREQPQRHNGEMFKNIIKYAR